MNGIDQRSAAYETVAEAIRFIRRHAGEQPTLDEVAAQVGLSAFHLQRTFSVWAGSLRIGWLCGRAMKKPWPQAMPMSRRQTKSSWRSMPSGVVTWTSPVLQDSVKAPMDWRVAWSYRAS